MKKNIFDIDKIFYSDEFFLELFNVPPISKVKDCNRSFRVFYLPSFHPEVCISICTTTGRCEISLVTMQTNIWFYQDYHRRKTKGEWPLETPTSAPNLWLESQHITSSRVDEFITKIDSILIDRDQETDAGLFLDGMSAYWEYSSDSGECYSYYDHINGNSDAFKFVYDVYKFASEYLKEEKSIRVLENIYGYFQLSNNL